MKFVKREQELKLLNKEYERDFSFIVIYGRRRVGKTKLIEEFIKQKKAIYFLAANQEDRLQILDFKKVILNVIYDELLQSMNFDNWNDFFSYLEKIWPKNEKIILAVDEITYIIKQNKAFTSYLQRFIDTFLSKTKTTLILSGSIVGLLLKEVLSYESPLYGRRTAQIQLKEFNFFDSCVFLKHFSIEDKIGVYSIVGGVPKYLELIEKENNFKDIIINNFFNKNGFFNKESLFLFSEEFKEPSTYINILKAISFGNSKLNEISNYTGLEGKKISSYLDILIELQFIKKIIPIIENPKKFRGAIYKINDNYLIFWHRFVFPNRSEIELGKEKFIYENNKLVINQHISFAFEDICRDYIKINLSNFQVGTYWHKEIEIDICAINDEKKSILFGEVKWQDNVDAKKLLEELKEKAKKVNWINEDRKEEFVLFAKSFKSDTKARTKTKIKDCKCYDLKDIEKGMMLKKR